MSIKSAFSYTLGVLAMITSSLEPACGHVSS